MIFDNPNVSNRVKLQVLHALLFECCKVDTELYGDTFLKPKSLCGTYMYDTTIAPEVIQQFIAETSAMLTHKYETDIADCIKIQNEIIQLRADYPHLDIELGTYEPAIFDDPKVYTETANLLLSLRERLHECLIDVGYYELNAEYFRLRSESNQD